MEKIPVNKLKDLANMLHEEPSNPLRNKLSAWCTSNATNPEHASLSSLSAMAEQSTIKDKINEWVSNLTTTKPEFVYVPDVPAQMDEEIKEEVRKETTEVSEIENEVENSLPETIEEHVSEKVKKPRKKKTD